AALIPRRRGHDRTYSTGIHRLWCDRDPVRRLPLESAPGLRRRAAPPRHSHHGVWTRSRRIDDHPPSDRSLRPITGRCGAGIVLRPWGHPSGYYAPVARRGPRVPFGRRRIGGIGIIRRGIHLPAGGCLVVRALTRPPSARPCRACSLFVGGAAAAHRRGLFAPFAEGDLVSRAEKGAKSPGL